MPPRSHRIAPGRAAPAPRSCLRRPLGEMAVQELFVERREIEAPRRLVDELHPIHAGVVPELLLDPLHGLLDRRLTCRHVLPPFSARSTGATGPRSLYSAARWRHRPPRIGLTEPGQ